MGLVKSVSLPCIERSQNEDDEPDPCFKPFISVGFVSLTGDPKDQQPVKMLRDTGGSQSIIREGILPLSTRSSCRSRAVVQGVGMGFIPAPLHNIHVQSSMVSGVFKVAVHPALPIKGVDFILSNDLAGGKVMLVPEVLDSPDFKSRSENPAQFLPEIVPACVVTRAPSKRYGLAKCVFGKGTVLYLGQQVGQGKVCPVDAKVAVMAVFPTTRRALRHFLGMIGYYRLFCKNSSSVAAPLTALTSPLKPFVWSSECQQSFESLKGILSCTPVLSAPNFSLPFKLEVDASAVGAGAALLQEDDQGIDHPVSYFSRKFNKQQLRYSTIEEEALSLVFALQHFEVYLGSSVKPIKVFTDHNPLVFLSRMYNHNQRLRRLALIVQDFNFEISHKKGSENVLADALSHAI